MSLRKYPHDANKPVFGLWDRLGMRNPEPSPGIKPGPSDARASTTNGVPSPQPLIELRVLYGSRADPLESRELSRCSNLSIIRVYGLNVDPRGGGGT